MQRQPWASGSEVTNARQWVKFNRAARLHRKRPGYLEVRYEDLVIDPVREFGRICSFVGEEYSPLMMVPDRDGTADSDSPTRWQTAVTSERLKVWRNELTTAQVAQIEFVLGPEMEGFGYQRTPRPHRC